MEEITVKILFVVIGLVFSIAGWMLKETFKALKEMKQFDIDNKDKIRDNFFSIKRNIDDIVDVKIELKEHEKRIDKNEKDINTIVITHNNTCPNSKIEVSPI